ncbi:hypothetical protein NUACC21_68320 [Scytonema sp. NUACC21]
MQKVIDYVINDLLYQAEKTNELSKIAEKAVEILDTVPGISPCHDRDFKWSKPVFVLKDGTVVKTCQNIIALKHIFLADSYGKLIYGAFADWFHTKDLEQAINRIRKELT